MLCSQCTHDTHVSLLNRHLFASQWGVSLLLRSGFAPQGWGGSWILWSFTLRTSSGQTLVGQGNGHTSEHGGRKSGFRSKSLGQPLTRGPDISRKPSSWSLSRSCIDSDLLHLDQETLDHAWKQLGKLLQDADTETHSRVQWSLDVYIFNTVPRYQCWSVFWNTQWKMSPKIISQLLSSSYIRVFQVLLSE